MHILKYSIKLSSVMYTHSYIYIYINYANHPRGRRGIITSNCMFMSVSKTHYSTFSPGFSYILSTRKALEMVFTHTDTYVYIHTYTHKCIHTHTHTRTNTHTHTHTHIYIYIYIYVCVCVCVCVCKSTRRIIISLKY